MASYPAPTETLPIFSPSVFETNDIPLTIEEGADHFITYPTAQGAITIPTLSTGTLGTSGTATIATAAITTANTTTANTGTLNVSGKLNITNSTSRLLGVGYEALLNGSGNHNTAFGFHTLRALTLGGDNTAIGDNALPILTGTNALTENNTAVGHQAGRYLAEGTDNTFIGFNAGSGTSSHTGGNFNTCVGSGAGRSLSTGDNNVFVGWDAGSNTDVGSNNTCLGYNTATTAGATFRTLIGSGATSGVDNSITLGRTTDNVRLNKITPMYATIAAAGYTSADVGFISSPTITYPTTTTNVIASFSSVPIGTYLVIVMLNMNGGPAILNVRGDSSVQGFIPAITRTTDWYSGSVITRITSTGTIDVLPLAAGATGTNASGSGQSVRIFRIA
jgi:hypothetical protein